MTNRLGVTGVALAGLLGAAAACSGSDKPSIFVSGGSGGVAGTLSDAGGKGGRTSGTTGGGTAGSGGSGGETTSPLGPQVSITNPVPASDPNADPVVLGDQVTVLCSATASTMAGAKPVDTSTIKIALLDGAGATVKSVSGVSTQNADEYSASFVLTEIPSGPIGFKCTASDTASPAHLGSGSVETLLDNGPDITIGQPVAASPHNLLTALDVEFTVAAAPISADDAQADVSAVTLQVAGKGIDLPFKGVGHYKTSVDFTALFPSPPTGMTPILITATNKRAKPHAVTNTLSYSFVLDGAGPVITLNSPAPGSVVGPATVLAFTVTDAGSGVDKSTVVVKLNDAAYVYDPADLLWSTDDAGNYTYKMGNRLQDPSQSQVTVNVLASDNAQNASKGNSRLFNLDTTPPTVDLDPPLTYLIRPGNDPATNQCSDLFDPVGSGAPNDLSTITNFGRFRSLVWDQTNGKLGQDTYYYALVDQASVRLYVQPDTTQPLLRGPAGKACNEIWTGTIPNQRNPADPPLQFVALNALPSETTPLGSVDWAVNATLLPGDPDCKPGSMSTSLKLCNGHSDMSILLHHPVVKNPHEPVIYAVQPDPANPLSPTCTGGQWDVATATTPAGTTTPKLGWICMAARAVDTVGNIGISAPLRICLDDGTKGSARCAGTPPPSCTDNCTAPSHAIIPPASFVGYD
jgi:hypothetical protein